MKPVKQRGARGGIMSTVLFDVLYLIRLYRVNVF